MIVILLGAPGAGKGTQSVFISKRYSVPQISTGNILREEVKNQTDLGLKAKLYMDKGELVPDSLIVEMVEKRIKKDDCENGFILDGFPRNVQQADALEIMLWKNKLRLNKVILIDVNEDVIVERLTGRRICPSCGNVYHIKYNPPSNNGICDECGSKLIQRDDDKEETVKNRLKIYDSSTIPLIEYYRNKGLLSKVEGIGDVNSVFDNINRLLE